MTELDRRAFLAQAGGSVLGTALVPESDLVGPRQLPAPKHIAVVGTGRHGRAILTELSKIAGAKVVAVCDLNPSRVKTALERAPGAEGFSDHRALLEKRRDLDAVIVATPTHLHRKVVEDALQAGKHVYCEAPLAHTIDDARAILAAAEAAKPRLFMAGFQARSNPVYQLARTFYRTDAFRDFIGATTHFHRKTSWRFPGSDPASEAAANWRLDPEISLGLAGEVGAHQFDVVHWFRGRYPASVTGHGGILLHKDGRKVADTVHASLRFGDGTAIGFEASLANSFGNQHEVVRGTNGAFKLAWTHAWMFKEVDAATLGWEVYALRQQFHQDEGIIVIADATKLAAIGQLKAGIGLPYPPLYYALGDFLRSVSFPNVPVATSARDGFRSTVIAILANQAVTSGSTVTVPADL
ncbi:MAG: Gfo/Idh/MocA family oxidoreductase [Gemmatimonadetes bacterium]|nr:Gfo/Idh/MocA family oxidoreductase [Gemmatimonadota bacterium]